MGRFGGVIPGPEWHNPCGMKTSSGGANTNPGAHAQFPDDLTGVRAHLDHLALYAGAPGYQRTDTPDPRHFPSIRGVARTIEQLGGRWAAKDYGESTVRDRLADRSPRQRLGRPRSMRSPSCAPGLRSLRANWPPTRSSSQTCAAASTP